IPEHRVARMFLTPSQLIDLLDWPEDELPDMSSVTNIIYGTAPTPAAKIEEALRRFGPIFQQGYGMAEVLPPVSLLQMEEHMRDGQPATRNVLSSVGRVVPQVQVIIANEKDAPLPPGEIGQVLIKSPTVFAGYWRQPELTARTLAGGWMHTGDFGFFDRDGYLHVLDRRPDLLRRGDRLIYPRTIEEVAHDHPSVKEACLVGQGTALVMCISLRRAARIDSGDSAAADAAGAEMMAFLAERIEPWQMPDRVRVLEELPRSYLRKVLRREIREMLAREAYTHEGHAISAPS
ncbi:MAG: fatty acid--CoA ligase family protein, partial [Gemmatimonadota bacterium]|nr:fatty acid--CoA ligase family protein [Gemmatimonadota bacterium]